LKKVSKIDYFKMSLHGVRDHFYHEAAKITGMESLEPKNEQVEKKEEKDDFDTFEARGEDPQIDSDVTARAFYQSSGGEHRRLSDAFHETAIRLSEPESFDSLFT